MRWKPLGSTCRRKRRMNSAASSVIVLEPVAAFDAVVLPLEGDAGLVERDQTGVRDRHAVGVAGEIGEHGFRSGEWPLGVDDPFGAAQRREGGVESALVGKGREVAEKGEPARCTQRCEPFEEEAGNRRERTRTGRKKPGLQAIQR